MVKTVATWLIIPTLALVTASAQFIGEYFASTSSFSIRASVSAGSVELEFERAGEADGLAWDFDLQGGPGDYSVDHSDFGPFKGLIAQTFPGVQIRDDDLKHLAPYDEIFFKTLIEGEEVFFLRKALPLRPGTYHFDDGGMQVTLEVDTGNIPSVFLNFRCRDVARGERFGDFEDGERTNIQFLKGANADYASFIRDVAESCPGSDLPTE
ncbi:hypothetical protein FOZ60_015783, partial [Perkinsus olseni]